MSQPAVPQPVPRPRRARLGDAGGIGAVQVASWRSTYRGIVPDDYLDCLDFLYRRLNYERVGMPRTPGELRLGRMRRLLRRLGDPQARLLICGLAPAALHGALAQPARLDLLLQAVGLGQHLVADGVPHGADGVGVHPVADRVQRVPAEHGGGLDRPGQRRPLLQQVLGPQLRPGAVVVMDNLTAHKGAEVAEALRTLGAQLHYLPP